MAEAEAEDGKPLEIQTIISTHHEDGWWNGLTLSNPTEVKSSPSLPGEAVIPPTRVHRDHKDDGLARQEERSLIKIDILSFKRNNKGHNVTPKMHTVQIHTKMVPEIPKKVYAISHKKTKESCYRVVFLTMNTTDIWTKPGNKNIHYSMDTRSHFQ